MNYYTRQGMKGMASKKSVPCRILNKESAIETQKSREDMMFNLNRFASGGRSKEAPRRSPKDMPCPFLDKLRPRLLRYHGKEESTQLWYVLIQQKVALMWKDSLLRLETENIHCNSTSYSQTKIVL